VGLKNLIQKSQQPTATVSVSIPAETRARLDSACKLLKLRRSDVLADALHDALHEMESYLSGREDGDLNV